MALHLNSVCVAGNLTRDPQVRFFANDKSVCDFGIAINRKFRTSDGEQKEETTFVDIECWNRQAELCGQYLTKGRNCMIEGSLKLDQWEDKDGNKRSKLKISAQKVHFIGSPKKDDERVPEEHQDLGVSDKVVNPESAKPAAEPVDDEPPF